MIDKIQDRLVADWRSFWRWWSTWLHVIGTTLLGIVALTPQLPQELQNAIPVEYRAVILALWAGLGIAARIIQQKKKPVA
jgi:hypothetical protein